VVRCSAVLLLVSKDSDRHHFLLEPVPSPRDAEKRIEGLTSKKGKGDWM